MAQSYAQICLHIIFSTKDRYPYLRDSKVRQDMHDYLKGACRKLGCPDRIINGTADHVHILCSLSRTVSVAGLLKGLKEPSSKWVKDQGGPMLKKFHWQGGYAAFSVSPSRLDAVHRYIANQEEHHRRRTFKEELIEFLKEHQVDYEEEYLWD